MVIVPLGTITDYEAILTKTSPERKKPDLVTIYITTNHELIEIRGILTNGAAEAAPILLKPQAD